MTGGAACVQVRLALDARTECLHYAMSVLSCVAITGRDSLKILEQAPSAARSFAH